MELKQGRNKLFQDGNGPRRAKGDMWVPLSIKKTNKQKNKNENFLLDGQNEIRREKSFFFFFSFLFFLRFTEIRPSDFVGSNTESALCDEGYAWEPKTRDFIENSNKNSEKS